MQKERNRLLFKDQSSCKKVIHTFTSLYKKNIYIDSFLQPLNLPCSNTKILNRFSQNYLTNLFKFQATPSNSRKKHKTAQLNFKLHLISIRCSLQVLKNHYLLKNKRQKKTKAKQFHLSKRKLSILHHSNAGNQKLSKNNVATSLLKSSK